MTFDYAKFRKAFAAAKRNLRISQQRIGDRPSAVGTRIPVRGKRRHCNQQGITRVHRIRLTELAAEQSARLDLPDDPIEKQKWESVWAADREAAIQCSKGKHLYGESRLRWISGHTGVLLSEVRYILRK